MFLDYYFCLLYPFVSSYLQVLQLLQLPPDSLLIKIKWVYGQNNYTAIIT